MKFKLLSLGIASAFLFTLAGCGGTEETPAPAPAPEAGETAENVDVNIALIAHSPESILDDGSFNQGAWDGITRFAADHGLVEGTDYRFFQPHTASDEARIDLINEAISGGANILVLPGFHFEASLYEAQDLFPDTKFILLDASPVGTRLIEEGEEGYVEGEENFESYVRIEDNVVAIHYAEEEAGFLAGYSAVMEGYRELGFMGGIAVPAVVRFGHGFIQGAEYAAAELGLGEGEVTINYHYLGSFAPDPTITTNAASWFAQGTEVIFVAAGGAGGSVMAAAESAGGSVIGVDVDQRHLSPDTVISSAVKGLDVSVYDMLTDFAEGHFVGGRELRFNAAINGVGLPMDNSQFQNFTQEQYDSIFDALKTGRIQVINTLEMSEVPTSLVRVNEL